MFTLMNKSSAIIEITLLNGEKFWLQPKETSRVLSWDEGNNAAIAHMVRRNVLTIVRRDDQPDTTPVTKDTVEVEVTVDNDEDDE